MRRRFETMAAIVRVASFLLASPLALLAITARANPHSKLKVNRDPTNSEAVEHVRHGNRALAPGVEDYETAIREYKAAAIADPVPLVWLDLGLAYRKAGRYSEAVEAYREFLSLSMNDDDPSHLRDQVTRLIPQLEAVRDAPPSHPEPGTVDSSTPSPVPSTGAASVQLAPPTAHDATMRELPSASVHGSSSRWRDELGWGFGVPGVLAVGVGVGFLASASSLDGQADVETDFSRRDQLRHDASSRRTIGTVSTIAGGVLLVAAGVRFALVGSSSTSSSTALHVTPGPGDVGLGLSLDF